MRRTRTTRTVRTVVVGVALAIALAGCVPNAPTPVATDPTPGTSQAAPDPSATPEPPRELDLAGDAESNQPYFDDTNRALLDADGSHDGRDFIDNLVDAGFPKAAMEVTPDRTSINADVDQLTFSVRLNGTCLIGQTDGDHYTSSATTLLASGDCLVGETRDIDW